MKKLLLLLTLAPYISVGQTTAIPDANFEQALINLGYDNVIDGGVLTANISGVTSLDVNVQGISDLTGIEDFTALDTLYCSQNQLTSIDVSQNTALKSLNCNNNQLTSLDVSQNTALDTLYCSQNQLTNLDVSQNAALKSLNCDNNQLTSLDVTGATALTGLSCSSNNLFCLNVANGNNTNMSNLSANSNPNLSCIEVDDENYSLLNWTGIDNGVTFSTDCNNSCSAICVNDTIINDTTTNYVSTPSFSATSPAVYLDNTENLTTADGCDSILNHYSQFVFSDDTTFVTIYDTILTSVTDTLIIDITLTGIPLPNNTNTMLVYPNPASDVVFIDNGDYSTMTGYTLKIINTLGQEVFNSNINVPQFQIPVSNFGAEGLYYIAIFDDNNTLLDTRKLILN